VLACVPGESFACSCSDSRPGAQVCDDDGERLGPCVCDGSVDDDGGLDDGGGGGSGGGGDGAADDGSPADGGEPQIVSFSADIVPIFEATCGASTMGCHTAAAYNASGMADCRSPTPQTPNAGGGTIKRYVVPGDPDQSYLLQRANLQPDPCDLPDEPGPMPPVGSIADQDLELIERWIEQGAPIN
jgi:hypothetical protein